MKTEIFPLLLDRDQAAALLNMSVRDLERKTAGGKIPGHCKPAGGRSRWVASILTAWADSGCPDILDINATQCAKSKQTRPQN